MSLISVRVSPVDRDACNAVVIRAALPAGAREKEERLVRKISH
jgi:hypothetical protein